MLISVLPNCIADIDGVIFLGVFFMYGYITAHSMLKDANCKTVNQYNSMNWRDKIKVEVVEGEKFLIPVKTVS